MPPFLKMKLYNVHRRGTINKKRKRFKYARAYNKTWRESEDYKVVKAEQRRKTKHDQKGQFFKSTSSREMEENQP